MVDQKHQNTRSQDSNQRSKEKKDEENYMDTEEETYPYSKEDNIQ